MKRKALITATAVLLVAVMCLATASYAWFSKGSATTVTSLNLSVTSGDSGLQIAAADVKNATYTAGAFTTASLSDADFTTYGIIPSDTARTLEAVSTSGVATNGAYTFTPTTYNQSTATWTGAKDKKDGYILVSFYAKNSGSAAYNGTLSVTFDETMGAHSDFLGAAKIGYGIVTETGVANKGDAPVTGKIPAGFTTYQLDKDTEVYADMLAEGADCVKTDDGMFVPKTVYDDDPDTEDDESVTLPAANAARFATIADDEMANAEWSNQSVSIGANTTALITVALWIEGMDSDCAGAWTAGSGSITISLS